ncbi:BC85_0335 family putative methyltransferase [Mycoplasma sp. Ms02]|uniref:BC85_0335 family putative methyltransferase n=1 Tax=Mycoplasma sp. Ms02 TaxID=353851 RepID=UPI001C893619|nr:hypothetical protein [Mycoplasma sp. Ms02]QZE12472.1 hypothetical protein K4L35_00565 [Mycoplasma sp. Ms02]
MIKTILLISVFVVLIVGFSVYFTLMYLSRRLRKKYTQEEEKRLYQELRKVRDDIGILPFELKDAFNSKIEDLDVEFLINTIYINDYKHNLANSFNDNYLLAALQEKTKQAFYYQEKEFNTQKWNEIYSQNKELINFTPISHTNQNLDCVIFHDTDLSNKEIFEAYYPLLNQNGMIIINQKYQKNNELKNLMNFLKEKEIKNQITFAKSKFLLISKTN